MHIFWKSVRDDGMFDLAAAVSGGMFGSRPAPQGSVREDTLSLEYLEAALEFDGEVN